MANVYLLVAVSKRSIIIDALLSKIHRETREIFQISFEICRHIRNYMYNLHDITYILFLLLMFLKFFFPSLDLYRVQKSKSRFDCSQLYTLCYCIHIYIFTIDFFRLLIPLLDNNRYMHCVCIKITKHSENLNSVGDYERNK